MTLLIARAVPDKLGLLMTEAVDLSLRKLPAVTIRLPFRMSRNVSSCTILSSVAMPLGSTHTGRADVELPPAAEAFVAFLLAIFASPGLLIVDCVLPGMLEDKLDANSCRHSTADYYNSVDNSKACFVRYMPVQFNSPGRPVISITTEVVHLELLDILQDNMGPDIPRLPTTVSMTTGHYCCLLQI